MNEYGALKRAVTYLPQDLYQALRRRAFDNSRTISTELKALIQENVGPESSVPLEEQYILQYALSKVVEMPGLKWAQYAAGFDGFIKREIHALGWTEDTVLHRLKADGKLMTDEGGVIVISSEYKAN